MSDRAVSSPRQLAAWCEREQQRVEQQLPWLQRPEALLRILTVLVTQLAAEHREDELGAATDRLLGALAPHLGTDTLAAALDSWRRAPEIRPGEPLRPPPGWGEGEGELLAQWYEDFEFELATNFADAEDDDVDDEDEGPPLRA